LHEEAVFILAYGVCNLPAAINRTTIREHTPLVFLANVHSRIAFLCHFTTRLEGGAQSSSSW